MFIFKGSSERLKLTPECKSFNLTHDISISHVSGIEPFNNLENSLNLTSEVSSELFVTCTNCSSTDTSIKCQCEKNTAASSSNKRYVKSFA